ncbi:hypothetical protein BOO25_18770 [Vibrio navarrensis]|nr:hypothetical protein [Vibrio navarrensis]HDY7840652.1 hypothetical protein [Vibrio vulnificus]
MASEKALIKLMSSRQRLWSPAELCAELGIPACGLGRLIQKARKRGSPIRYEYGEHTAYTSKYWVREG